MLLTILAPFPSPQTLWAQDETVELTDEEARLAEKNLRAVLAGPRDQAFHQVLTDISLKPGVLSDTTFLFDIYDIVVRYDPQRYRAPHAGLYPLTFEDQFIHWGKRLALYSRSIPWKGGRFFLYDISSGRQAWMELGDMRRLQPAPARLPPAPTPEKPEYMAAWLKHIYALNSNTDLQSMSRWFSMIRHETQEELARRLQSAAAPEGITPTTEDP
jgi:hypothetical protein